MTVTYNHNPFTISARIDQIVWRVVFAENGFEFNAEEVLEGGPAPAKENEWEALHEEDPDAFLGFIQGDLSGARYALERAQENGAQGTSLENLQNEVNRLDAALRKAIDLARELKVEASVLRSNNNESDSGLKLTFNSMPEDTAPLFSLHTVYEWLIDRKIADVREWARPGSLLPRRERRYTNRLLIVLDAAIQEFYEDYDPNRLPTNAAIEKWIKTTFPEHDDLLSQKVIEAMCKIMKPDKP
jgi:hypothetical protein